MKKVCWLLILVLVIGCFVGCQEAPAAQRPIENEDGTLADWMKAEIEKLYHDHAHPTYTFDDPSIIRYYGTDNGYVLVFERTGHQSMGEVVVADKCFTASWGFWIRAYKDGQFIRIEEAYEQGLISKAAIDKAWEIHQEYQEKG